VDEILDFVNTTEKYDTPFVWTVHMKRLLINNLARMDIEKRRKFMRICLIHVLADYNRNKYNVQTNRMYAAIGRMIRFATLMDKPESEDDDPDKKEKDWAAVKEEFKREMSVAAIHGSG